MPMFLLRRVRTRLALSGLSAIFAYYSAFGAKRTCGERARMRINIWIILAVLLALLVITRYMQHEQDTDRICANDPTASVCQR
jgi:hypothetical protein